MSILLVRIVPQGMVFGADRNISFTRTKGDILERDDKTYIINQEITFGQSQRPKVLRWPNRDTLIGYAGEAMIGGTPADEYLYKFIGENLDFSSFEDLSESLRLRVETQRNIDEGSDKAKALIIHIGGFEVRANTKIPVVWLVTNAYALGESGYEDIRKEFKKTEEFWKYFPEVEPKDIRSILNKQAAEYQPFGFQQGIDLGTFNMLSASVNAAFQVLFEAHPKQHSFPKNISDWEAQVRMSVLTYGAYFQAYRNAAEQYVGGGADAVSIAWPEQ